MSEEQSQILLEQASPYEAVNSVVESDGRTVYLYLDRPDDKNKIWRACWVRNLRPAPAGPDKEALETGCAPLLPFDACKHPAGLPAPRAEDLALIWFPEGDSVALTEHGDVIAVIPPWAGLDGCSGYARDCTDMSPVCWPLGAQGNNATLAQVREAQGFWREWETGDVWPHLQAAYLSAIEAGLGCAHSADYSIDSGRFPPKFLARVDRDDAAVLVTGGVSVRPQPEVVKRYKDPSQVRRVEVGLALHPSLAGGPLTELLSSISSLVGIPWAHQVWLASGHTMPARGVPVGPSGTRFDALLVLSEREGAPPITFAPYRGDTITLHWLVPITEAERKLAMDTDSMTLIKRLLAANVGWVHTDRACVAST